MLLRMRKVGLEAEFINHPPSYSAAEFEGEDGNVNTHSAANLPASR